MVRDELFDNGISCGAEANIAKLLSSEASWKAAESAMQTFGGYGFAEDYDIERKYRETRLYQTAPISTNLILAFIAQKDAILRHSIQYLIQFSPFPSLFFIFFPLHLHFHFSPADTPSGHTVVTYNTKCVKTSRTYSISFVNIPWPNIYFSCLLSS